MWNHTNFTNGPAQQIQNLPLYSLPRANIESQIHHCVYQLCDSITEVSLENIRKFWICCSPIIFSRFWGEYANLKIKSKINFFFFPFFFSSPTSEMVRPTLEKWRKKIFNHFSTQKVKNLKKKLKKYFGETNMFQMNHK